ncbi:AMP-binding protein [Winogradskyella aurantiaca]|uniref:AMP-binding protein n=1 Tax=Winogradskyella aurantiaca TaxID=2219558 RepID=UPI000E1E063F|nr:AMP-binding protein [Winogradskyella aurantiaca]
MTPTFDKVHNRFKFNGLHFSHEELKEVSYSLIKEGEPYEQVTGDFLIDWLNDKDHIYVRTSGSTGQPKSIRLMKQAMVNSAIATGDFFGLNPGDKAIDCLPSHFIAGKMMLVRALILGLEIDCIEPSSNPVFDYDKKYQFCAMIPLQLKNTLERTGNIETMIVGGSKVTKPLRDKIALRPNLFYETYGMTETITHVAVRRLESKDHAAESSFHALPNVNFSQDDRDCLIIEAPNVLDEHLVTNDIVELEDAFTFVWKGRYDNVINSTGVKLFPEQIEDKLQPLINTRYIVAGIDDEALGEKLVLVVEGENIDTNDLLTKISSDKSFSKFEVPKEIIGVTEFVETVNGKIQRAKTLEAALIK